MKAKITDKLLDLLEKSVLVQGSIALVLVITICVLALMQITVPSLLEYSVVLSLGFFFGAKSTLKPKQEV